MRPPRFGTGTLMLLVVIAALAAALVAQHFRAARREFALRADLYRLTPTPSQGGDGAMALVCDRLVIAFRPRIYRRAAGARYRWRFELVDPATGAVVLSHRDDREAAVPPGLPFNPGYLEVLDRLPPPGAYRARFTLSVSDPDGGAAGGWSELSVYEDDLLLPPRGGAEAGAELPPGV